MFTCENE